MPASGSSLSELLSTAFSARRPILHAEWINPEEDFPSHDANPPLKTRAVFRSNTRRHSFVLHRFALRRKFASGELAASKRLSGAK